MLHYGVGLVVLFLLMAVFSGFRRAEKFGKQLDVMALFRLFHFTAGCLVGIAIPVRYAATLDMALGPTILFCLAWSGFFYGCHLDIRQGENITSRFILLHTAGPVIVFIVTASLGIVISHWGGNTSFDTNAVMFLALLCTISLFRRNYTNRDTKDSPLHTVTHDFPPVRNLLPITVFCLAASIVYGSHEIMIFGKLFDGVVTFIGGHIILGVVAGMLISTLATGNSSREALVLSFAGSAALIGGATDLFLMSPVFTGIVAGTFVINSTTKRCQILDALFGTTTTVEKILMFLLGYYAGTRMLVKPQLFWTMIAIGGGIALLRLTLQYGLALLWTTRFHAYNKGSRLLLAAMTGQGLMAVALCAEYMLRTPDTGYHFILFIGLVLASQMVTCVIIRDKY